VVLRPKPAPSKLLILTCVGCHSCVTNVYAILPYLMCVATSVWRDRNMNVTSWYFRCSSVFVVWLRRTYLTTASRRLTTLAVRTYDQPTRALCCLFHGHGQLTVIEALSSVDQLYVEQFTSGTVIK